MRWIACEAAVFVLAAALFRLFPELDLGFSGKFYDPERGFFLAEHPAILFIYRAVPYLLTVTLAAAALVSALNRWRGWTKIRLSGRGLAFLLLTLALGPGLLVHTVFKDHWGRPRPRSVREFGGDKRFQPAFSMSSECERNCSFPSGHASAGFFFASFALLGPAVNPAAAALGLAAGLLIGLGRIAQGGHFLSDVVFAGFFTWFTARALRFFCYRAMLDPEKR